jgi:hypothetical protein
MYFLEFFGFSFLLIQHFFIDIWRTTEDKKIAKLVIEDFLKSEQNLTKYCFELQAIEGS